MAMPSQMNRFTLIRFLLAGLMALSGVLLQAGTRPAAHPKTLTPDTWGGEHIILEVSDKGAEAEFDCARGQITQPIALDKRGHFDVTGTFTPEHGGPIRRDEETTPAPVRYSGRVASETMELTITRGEGTLGTYTLTRGSHPMLRKCR
jgi:hypothetical protein